MSLQRYARFPPQIVDFIGPQATKPRILGAQLSNLGGQWLGLDGLQRFELCQIGGTNKLELAAEAFPGAIVLANELRTVQ